jgi:N-acetylmuramoyl-L-alanine amidase
MTLLRAFASLALAAAAYGQSTSITAIRNFTQGESARVVVEFSGDFRFTHERLSNPDRVFFDIPNAELRLDSAAKRAATIAIGDSFVRQVRAAETRPGVMRIVFDLARNGAEYTVTELANPPRLAVDFRGGGQAPAAKRTVVTPPPPRISLEQMRREAALAAVTGKVAPPPAAMPVGVVTPAPAPVFAEPKVSPAPAPVAVAPVAPATPARQPSRSLTRALGLKLGRIVIDPGHGGHDLGTTSASGMHEKDLVLDIAKRLGELLTRDLGAQVIFTRTDDTFVPLEKRTAIANAQRADLFLSLHANYSRLKTISGPETFYLNFAGSREAMELAAAENASGERSVFELQDLVKQITLNDKVAESREFAAKVQANLVTLGPSNRKDRGVKRAPFVVLIGASMPSILAEIGFLSNSREEALLKTPEYRQKVAEALAKGIASYAETLSRMDMARAAGSAADAQ